MSIKAKDYIEDVPDSELLDKLKKGLKIFNNIYEDNNFREILSSFLVLLDTIPMMPYSESIFFSIQQQIQEKYDLQDGIENFDEDSIKKEDKEQIREWMNFIMIAIAGLATKLDTIDNLASSGNEDINISDEIKEQIKELGKNNIHQA